VQLDSVEKEMEDLEEALKEKRRRRREIQDRMAASRTVLQTLLREKQK